MEGYGGRRRMRSEADEVGGGLGGVRWSGQGGPGWVYEWMERVLFTDGWELVRQDSTYKGR